MKQRPRRWAETVTFSHPFNLLTPSFPYFPSHPYVAHTNVRTQVNIFCSLLVMLFCVLLYTCFFLLNATFNPVFCICIFCLYVPPMIYTLPYTNNLNCIAPTTLYLLQVSVNHVYHCFYSQKLTFLLYVIEQLWWYNSFLVTLVLFNR